MVVYPTSETKAVTFCQKHLMNNHECRLVDKSLNVSCGDSVPTLPAIPAVFSQDCWLCETTALTSTVPLMGRRSRATSSVRESSDLARAQPQLNYLTVWDQ